jgi:hypothetical protein
MVKRGAYFGARRGSSLAEMLIAIVVLAVVLISMFGMFLISSSSVKGKDDETANSLALRYLEEVEAYDFNGFVTGEKCGDDIVSGKYKISSLVRRKDDYSATVDVTVTWPSNIGGQASLTLERVISSGGHLNVGQLAEGISGDQT